MGVGGVAVRYFSGVLYCARKGFVCGSGVGVDVGTGVLVGVRLGVGVSVGVLEGPGVGVLSSVGEGVIVAVSVGGAGEGVLVGGVSS